MKVYAEYYKLANGDCYRRKTLLQFGDSINLIGSAVLINPGSAEAIGEANLDMIKMFYKRNHNVELDDMTSWKLFNDDSTMLQLEKIFNGWYLGKNLELNGVIQLFNCSYYKNPDLNAAREKFDLESDYNFNEENLLLDKPVYFGWGGEGRSTLKPIALKIFEDYKLNSSSIYHSEFINNKFYHPGYINRSYKRNENTKKILSDFYDLVEKSLNKV